MASVIIGMDPHKRSVTIEVMNERENVLLVQRFGTDRDGFKELLRTGRRFPDRTWAVEGCNGIGRHVAQRLVAAGEPVVDVPPKLSARTRVFSTGNGRKTDPVDAHSIALAALRTQRLRVVEADDATVALRLLVDRRDELGVERSKTINQIHRLLLELLPGGAKKFVSAAQARDLLAAVRPRDIVGRTRRQLASELISELIAIDKKIKTAKKQLAELVAASGSTLLDVHGNGPSGAARLLGDVGNIDRFPSKAHFASWNGTAPLDASSGDQKRHRLSREGNRKINRTLHIMAIVQLRHDTEGRRYYDRKRSAGKTNMEAMRCLKRRLFDLVYRQMINDARKLRTGPGGHPGATLQSSAADSHPDIDTSDQPQPGPVTAKPRTAVLAAS
jgi:transposase